MKARDLWGNYKRHWCEVPSLGLSVDVSRMRFDADFFERSSASMRRAFEAMDALEAGAIANPDEKRMVGHYWLRAAGMAPTDEIRGQIDEALAHARSFAAAVRTGHIRPPRAPRFTQLVCIGIGGSALGPMFVADALGDDATGSLAPHFLDNTDPDGFARLFAKLSEKIGEALIVVTSKSGGTPETRNGML
ncbi:MAG TPA: glucose-6-phosphate isomerase, partial [Anaeromyxobacteraceae bacterium]|nr:glucose-6-phosphate isomerase [Anaeromyxobacteraceae bacterium]